jgi:hypothetical protein
MKSPLWPKPGQLKVAFGNMTDKAVEVSVAGKGAPNGPTLDLAPGKYDLSLKSGEREPDRGRAGGDLDGDGRPGGLLAIRAF